MHTFEHTAQKWFAFFKCSFEICSCLFFFAFVVADEAILGMHLNDFDASLMCAKLQFHTSKARKRAEKRDGE